MAKKKKRLLDQLYNGAYENAELSAASKKTLYLSAGIITAGLLYFLKSLK